MAMAYHGLPWPQPWPQGFCECFPPYRGRYCENEQPGKKVLGDVETPKPPSHQKRGNLLWYDFVVSTPPFDEKQQGDGSVGTWLGDVNQKMMVCWRKPSYALAMSEGPSHLVLISCVGCTKTLQSGVALPGGPGPSEVRPPRGLMKWIEMVPSGDLLHSYWTWPQK